MGPELRADGEDDTASKASPADASDRERALLRAAVKEAHDQALASSRAKSEFLATMSHEMRTPLNAVVGYAELLDLELPGALNPVQRSYVDRIRTASSRLLALISDVLDLAKLDAGRLVLARERASASSVVNDAVRAVQLLADDRGVRIAAHSEADPEFIADRRRVEQIVRQLLSNAVRFSEKGSEVTVLATRFQAPNGAVGANGSASCWCSIRVEDSGRGISERDMDSIFQPFTQVDGTLTRAEEGTGLGLTIVRRLARLMGGDLSVTSRLGAGSVFTLWLPAPALLAEGATTECAIRERRGLTRSARGLVDVAEAMLADLDGLIDRFVQRLRTDPQVATVAARMDRHVLEDHSTSFLADIAQSLIVIEGAGGEPAQLMRDAADIQLLIADRHGAYRQRAGWTEHELEREYDLLLESIDEVVRTALPATAEFPPDSIDAGLALVRRFVERAREQGRTGYRRAAIGVDADVDVAIPLTSGGSAATASTSTRLS
ncbi:MAG: sensor histidine kinase [Gemmatimonadaceae bacterium]